MFKNFGLKFLVLIMVSVLATSNLTAQTRIRFARGASSATMSGTLGAGATRGFVLRAARGQTLTATLSCGNGKCDFTQGDLHDTQYSHYVDRNGDVYISIDNHGNRATKYTMVVSIQ